MGSLLCNHSRRKHVLTTTTQWMVRGINLGISNQNINKIWECLTPGIANKSISVISCSTPVLNHLITHSCSSHIPFIIKNPCPAQCPCSDPHVGAVTPREEPDPALPLQSSCEKLQSSTHSSCSTWTDRDCKNGFPRKPEKSKKCPIAWWKYLIKRLNNFP